jgi:hypothetical protein
MLGSASSLAFELAGLEAGDDFAQVEVAGTAGLAGSLEIGLDSDYLPAAGDSFTLLAPAGGISGSFTNTVLPSLPTGLSWLLGYSNSDVMLSVTAASLLTGDYNGNGTVEQADLDLVLLNWGAAGSPPPTGWTNDLPDGQIDQGELDGILLNWGNTGSAAMQGSLVPEPSSLVLAVTLVLALSYWFITARIGAAGTTPVSR